LATSHHSDLPHIEALFAMSLVLVKDLVTRAARSASISDSESQTKPLNPRKTSYGTLDKKPDRQELESQQDPASKPAMEVNSISCHSRKGTQSSSFSPRRAAEEIDIEAQQPFLDSGNTTENGEEYADDFMSEKSSSKSTKIDARVLSDAIIGLSDGLTVPFALTAGLSALGDTKVVIFGGLAELIAGAISMGLGGYLGAKSES
jgi:VIT family